MPSILSTNMASLYAQRSLASAQTELAGSVQKLSSGRRINSAKDNAAGLGISEGVASIRNISDQSIRNLQSATSLVQTADGALEVVGKMLQRALTLTTQKDNLILNDAQRTLIDNEITSIIDEIARIESRTTFNDSASVFGRDYTFGAGSGVTKTIDIPDLTSLSLGLETGDVTPGAFNIAGIANGSILRYINPDGAAIAQMTDGEDYEVTNSTGNSFKLLQPGSQTELVPITALGGGAVDDYFINLTATANIAITSTVNTSNVLLVNQDWEIDGVVEFSANSSNNNLGGLVDEAFYRIASRTNSTLVLRTGPTTINYGPTANLDGTTLTLVNRGDTITLGQNSIQRVNLMKVADASVFSNEDVVVFRNPGNPVAGLVDGDAYIVRDIDIVNDTFKLYKLNGDAITQPDLRTTANITLDKVTKITFDADDITLDIGSDEVTTLMVSDAIAVNATNRASLGAQLNTLDYAIDNLQTLSNNLSEAYSRIVDTDYAAETAALTRNQILQQAATSMLAQANQMPNVILTLLK